MSNSIVTTVEELKNLNESGYDIIVLAGQSNCVGYYGPVDVEKDAVNSRIKQMDQNNIIRPALDPIDHFNNSLNVNDQVGCGLSLAKEFLPYINPNRDILLLPCANGSTGFQNDKWNKGDLEYENTVRRINSAMKLNGNQNRVLAIVWVQGETDTSAADDYQNALDTFIKNLRNDLKGNSIQSTPDMSKIPFITCGFGKDYLFNNTFLTIPDVTETGTHTAVSTASDDFNNNSAHNFVAGDEVRVTTTGTLSSNLALYTSYFVGIVDANNFSLHNTKQDAIAGTNLIDITDKGSGNLVFLKIDTAREKISEILKNTANRVLYSGAIDISELRSQAGAGNPGSYGTTNFSIVAATDVTHLSAQSQRLLGQDLFNKAYKQALANNATIKVPIIQQHTFLSKTSVRVLYDQPVRVETWTVEGQYRTVVGGTEGPWVSFGSISDNDYLDFTSLDFTKNYDFRIRILVDSVYSDWSVPRRVGLATVFNRTNGRFFYATNGNVTDVYEENNGTLTGNAALENTANAKTNTGRSIPSVNIPRDSTANYIATGYTITANDLAYTKLAKIYLNAGTIASLNNACICAPSVNSGSNNNLFWLSDAGAGNPRLAAGHISSNYNQLRHAYNVVSGQWVDVAVTRQDVNTDLDGALYINGELVDTGNMSPHGTEIVGDIMDIGNFGRAISTTLGGRITDAAFIAEALTAEEIRLIHGK